MGGPASRSRSARPPVIEQTADVAPAIANLETIVSLSKRRRVPPHGPPGGGPRGPRRRVQRPAGRVRDVPPPLPGGRTPGRRGPLPGRGHRPRRDPTARGDVPGGPGGALPPAPLRPPGPKRPP